MININQPILTVCSALRDERSVDFVCSTVKAGYREFFRDHLKEVEAQVDRAFEALASSQRVRPDPGALSSATESLLKEVFRKDDLDFWFNQGYHRYKTRHKPATDARFLLDLIQGERLLDYGCGSGYLSTRLAREGYQIYTTDVLDYRYAEAKTLPFVQMTVSGEIPYPPGSMDTALVQAVLHHIDPENLDRVIAGLAGIARQVIIKEDTYDLPVDMPGLAERVKEQPLLRQFVSLPAEQQFQALTLIDYYANAVAQGIPEMNMPFEFKMPGEWRRVLKENGLHVERVILAGFEPGRIHKSCHIWMLAESEI